LFVFFRLLSPSSWRAWITTWILAADWHLNGIGTWKGIGT
jgi:hypothetical protein